jgi:hypothetical protein
MANDLIPPSDRFARAIAVRANKGAETVERMATPQPPPPAKSPRARLNVFPDDSALAVLVDRALTALSRGVVWARGAIVNLVV